MDRRFDFYSAAVVDAQGIIKALDVKLNIVFTIQILVLSKVFFIIEYCKIYIRHNPGIFSNLMVNSVFLFWLLAIVASVTGISAIDNPSAHISGAGKEPGKFYYGNVFPSLNFLDIIINRRSIITKRSFNDLILNDKTSTEILIRELAFEHIKLVYIREIKIHRLKWSIRFFSASALLGLVIYLFLGVYFRPNA